MPACDCDCECECEQSIQWGVNVQYLQSYSVKLPLSESLVSNNFVVGSITQWGAAQRAKEMDRRKAGDKRQTKVKVVIRVRPPLAAGSKICVGTAGNKVEIFNHRNVRENLQYE